jgi:hypothetical protein
MNYAWVVIVSIIVIAFVLLSCVVRDLWFEPKDKQ